MEYILRLFQLGFGWRESRKHDKNGKNPNFPSPSDVVKKHFVTYGKKREGEMNATAVIRTRTPDIPCSISASCRRGASPTITFHSSYSTSATITTTTTTLSATATTITMLSTSATTTTISTTTTKTKKTREEVQPSSDAI